MYGLQRAFLVAGAEAMVMSLWKVDDAATQQLMNNFYTNWIKTGDKQKAFKQAQLATDDKIQRTLLLGCFCNDGKLERAEFYARMAIYNCSPGNRTPLKN